MGAGCVKESNVPDKTIEAGRHRRVVIVGLGAIGRPVARLLARTPCVGALALVDFDIYEPKNTQDQFATQEEIGQTKVEATARECRRMHPGLDMAGHACMAEDIPLGLYLDSDLVIGALDNNLARMHLNQICFRLGVEYVDAAVNAWPEAGGLFARVTTVLPNAQGEDGTACLQCEWTESTYDRLEQRTSCLDGRLRSRPTLAPMALSNLAASYAALEAGKILGGQTQAVAREVLLDAANHTSRVLMDRTKRADCRFAHDRWEIQRLKGGTSCSFGQVLRRAASDLSCTHAALMGPFDRRLVCERCGRTVETIRLHGRPAPACDCCGGRWVGVGFFAEDEVDQMSACASAVVDRSLEALGFVAQDILTVRSPRSGAARHYLLTEEV